MLALFPEGVEERERAGEIELAAYTDEAGEGRVRAAFGNVHTTAVESGWEERWREFHRPVRVGPLWIGPPWAEPDARALAVVIEPGRAFGTGAHPTTRLMLELLLACRRGSVLDLGCGSGVLAVAAARLGFAPVVALDSDPVAAAVAGANAAANGVTLDVRVADVLVEPLPSATVALANIELAAVEQIAARVDSDTLLASGYLARDHPTVPGWRRGERCTADGWAADRFERR
jgi:ribosomal protein L11 methyltransferase